MNKAYLIITALFFLAATAMAQKPEVQKVSPEEAAKFRTERMLERGIINEDQVDKAYGINLQEVESMREASENRRLERDKIRKERDAIRERSKTEWGKLLTPDQQQRMEEHRKEMREKFRLKREGKQNKRFHKMERKQEHKPRMEERK